ncbi:hypothetical protein CCACVL1_25127 [Corchorus capsularis]|uniref:Uncharacterized protein n=1 Tax=Corchorus capsularis TaxID=210143 RepID=A0A1R3GLU1_COCAP|nr:hypothetical protein CCACVL1_25127 [Corchorus capsularis]
MTMYELKSFSKWKNYCQASMKSPYHPSNSSPERKSSRSRSPSSVNTRSRSGSPIRRPISRSRSPIHRRPISRSRSPIHRRPISRSRSPIHRFRFSMSRSGSWCSCNSLNPHSSMSPIHRSPIRRRRHSMSISRSPIRRRSVSRSRSPRYSRSPIRRRRIRPDYSSDSSSNEDGEYRRIRRKRRRSLSSYSDYSSWGNYSSDYGFRRKRRSRSRSRSRIAPDEGWGVMNVRSKSSSSSGDFLRTDWRETDKEYVFEVDVPGMTKKDLSVKIKDKKLLCLRGEKRRRTSMWDTTNHHSEKKSGKFERRFMLCHNVDAAAVKAEIKHGVLIVTLPKEAAGEVKDIPISD